ncbi:TPA: hypothetical protein RM800_000579 [Yersinia enterocolitica]|nr:hypothetical protein [Yersinia enterocolitica]
MMDITKSREEFEKWLESRECNPVAWLKDAYWEVWEASRESLVVEFPERAKLERSGKNKGRYVCGPCSFDPEYALGINHTIDWFTEAIRTAGIRIKGESE